MQKVSVQSTYFSYVALSSSFKDIHVQAKVEEIFSWSLHAEKLTQPLQQFRKPFLWKFKEVAVASTILKLLIVAFRSVLDYNAALSDCRLVARELEDDFLQQLSCSFFFFTTLRCFPGVWKTFLSVPSLEGRPVGAWPAEDESGTLSWATGFELGYLLNIYLPV